MSSDESPGLATRSVADSRRLSFGRFRLVVVEGDEVGREAVSTGEEMSVGADDGNSLVLNDATVSRHHFTIKVTRDGPLLEDLGSTNGTTLAGFRVKAAYLRAGAVIGAGHTLMRFEPLADEAWEPLSSEEKWDRALGTSPAMRRIFAMLPRIAASEARVLLEGETGTGKGLLAEAIHRNSARAAGPLVVVDCGAIPPTLIESELFGHEKGAFTGAHAPREGAFEAANGGTVFLDEIGELPLEMQPKLLRALEERTIKRLGSVKPVSLDVRVISATNRDLRQEINRGNFRSDLFYRINIVRLRIPSLRERPEDIPLLVSHFYRQFVGRPDAEPPGDLISSLCRHTWPGNVRELRSAVERAVLLGDLELWEELQAAQIGGEPEPPAQPTGEPATPRPEPRDGSPSHQFDPEVAFRAAKELATARWEKWYIDELVRRHDGNLSKAANAARMDRNHLRELMRKHGVSGGRDD